MWKMLMAVAVLAFVCFGGCSTLYKYNFISPEFCAEFCTEEETKQAAKMKVSVARYRQLILEHKEQQASDQRAREEFTEYEANLKKNLANLIGKTQQDVVVAMGIPHEKGQEAGVHVYFYNFETPFKLPQYGGTPQIHKRLHVWFYFKNNRCVKTNYLWP